MNAAQASELQTAFGRMAWRFADERGGLPPSIERSDLVQEAFVIALEHELAYVDDGQAKWSTFLRKPVKWAWSRLIARQHFGPSVSVRSWRRKRGLPIDYGEVSIECLAAVDGAAWIESIAAGEEGEVSFFSLTLPEATACLVDIRRQLKDETGAGISFAKSRNKFHVEVAMRGRKQFIGQFKNLLDAQRAKSEFLNSFMDAVLDAVEET